VRLGGEDVMLAALFVGEGMALNLFSISVSWAADAE